MPRPIAGKMSARPPSNRVPDAPDIRILIPTVILATILLSLLALTPASAQDCVSEVTVIAGSSSGIQPPAGYTKIPVDLNQGAGGAFIYVCYKKGVGAPITGLAVTVNGGSPPTPYYTRIDVDLNQGCGGDTPYIWLWYTHDPACTAVHNLHVQPDTGAPPDGYTRIDVDLNQGAGGAFIYLCCEEY